MKKNKLLSLAVSMLTLASLVGCSKDSDSSSTKANIPSQGTITVWVGEESKAFYQEILNKYREDNNFAYDFNVVAQDAGEAAKLFLEDVEKGGDIITVPHDNLAKLTAGASAIMPVTDASLLAQIEADNPEMFRDVIKKEMNTKNFTFAVPYIGQSLVLYYNKAVVSDEQAKTFEGLAEAAKNASTADNKVKACTFLGNDGFNFSWSILARQMPGNTSTLKLYENKNADNCYFQGDDMVAVTKWAQDYFDLDNGATYPSSSGWEMELTPKSGSNVGKAVALVGGAWNYEKVKSALGEANVGVTKLPTFTTTKAYESIPAGTTFQAGSFYDCKTFVMKKTSPYVAELQKVVAFLASKEVQEQSFERCNNLPAYKNAQTEFEAMSANTTAAKLANMQYEMSKYAIPQPFGTGDLFNDYYYSSGTTDLYKSLIENPDGSLSSYDAIKAELKNIENVWKTGKQIGQ